MAGQLFSRFVDYNYGYVTTYMIELTGHTYIDDIAVPSERWLSLGNTARRSV